MGKNKGKNKDQIPNPTSVTNRDILQRLNFLYQASVLLNGLAPPNFIHRDANDPSRSPTIPNDKDTGAEQQDSPARPNKSQRKKRRRVVSVAELSRSYVETMKSVGRKTNVKMYVFFFFFQDLVGLCAFPSPCPADASSSYLVLTIHRPCTETRP